MLSFHPLPRTKYIAGVNRRTNLKIRRRLPGMSALLASRGNVAISKGANDESIFWIGLLVLILGVVSLVVPVPHRNREGFTVGGVSLGVETQSEEKVAPALSGVMIVGGLAAIIAANTRKSGQ